MKKIVYKTDDGIAVITPTKEGLAIFGIEGVTEKDVPRILPTDKQKSWATGIMGIAEYKKYSQPEHKIIDESEMPAPADYEYFKGAVQYDMSIDIPKAREIKKNKLRIDRAPLLAALDVDSMRAIENATDTTAIITEKNRLRDITLLVDAAKTINEIKAITLTV